MILVTKYLNKLHLQMNLNK